MIITFVIYWSGPDEVFQRRWSFDTFSGGIPKRGIPDQQRHRVVEPAFAGRQRLVYFIVASALNCPGPVGFTSTVHDFPASPAALPLAIR